MKASPSFFARQVQAASISSLLLASVTLTVLRADSLPTVPNMFATLAGAAGNPGASDGNGRDAGFAHPQGLAVDAARNVFVADSQNHTIRKITPAGVVSTIAGTAGVAGNADGRAAAATFNQPAGIALDAAGNLYVADRLNHAVRKISPAGVVSTLAGGFNQPQAVTVDADGNVFVADFGNHAVRKISADGNVSTLTDNFQQPVSVAVDAAGDVFVADAAARTISRISAAGVVSTLAGGFNQPAGVAVDAAGNLYVTDAGVHTLRKISAHGMITTIAGVADQAGAADGATGAALFNQPAGIAISAWGDVYVADSGNNLIREGYVFFPAPEITELTAAQQVVAPGQGFELSVAATGIGPLSYQWYHDGQPIAGANQSVLSDNAVTTAEKGAYSVAVTDDLGRNEKTFLVGVASAVSQVDTAKNPQTF